MAEAFVDVIYESGLLNANEGQVYWFTYTNQDSFTKRFYQFDVTPGMDMGARADYVVNLGRGAGCAHIGEWIFHHGTDRYADPNSWLTRTYDRSPHWIEVPPGAQLIGAVQAKPSVGNPQIAVVVMGVYTIA